MPIFRIPSGRENKCKLKFLPPFTATQLPIILATFRAASVVSDRSATPGARADVSGARASSLHTVLYVGNSLVDGCRLLVAEISLYGNKLQIKRN